MYPAWIGYRMYDPAVGFVWSDGSSVSSQRQHMLNRIHIWCHFGFSKSTLFQSSYQSWSGDEPNNLNNIENCVEMRISIWDSDGSWNDVNCQDRKDWYCQIRKGTTCQSGKSLFLSWRNQIWSLYIKIQFLAINKYPLTTTFASINS